MEIDKYDTANRNTSLMRSPLIWISKGNREGELSYVSSNSLKPYETIINFKPNAKGLYRINIINQAGQFKINNNYEARLLVNFNVPNKHINILGIIATYFGGQPTTQQSNSLRQVKYFLCKVV